MRIEMRIEMTDIQTDVLTDLLTDVQTNRYKTSTNIKRVKNEEFRVCDRPMTSETNVSRVYMDQ